ncbi:M16 family metallopeptidase [Porphyromonas somerae]|uniref:M16 family metallopeptidase n=1 Tax=Porphyromonas somerae TaxID=322095 RepID=UPI001FCBBB92|nr:insulinase family protein [Porphyromonas somerae]BDE81751.1 zinc protease [Porphyromonas somerae]
MNESVKEFILHNGLTVWISTDSSDSKVYGQVVVRAGAKETPNSGVAHYFEHIMFKGTQRIGTVDYEQEAPILKEITKQYSKLQTAKNSAEREEIQSKINELNIEATKYAIPNDFNHLISKYGGSGLNAGTSYDYTLFYNSFSPQYLEHWCELNSERMIAPVFRLFQNELETVYEEKNMYSNNISTEPTQRIMERLAAPHPYRYPIIGSTEALKSPDIRAMEDFFREYYYAENMALILTGDIKEEGLLPLLERTFGRIKSGGRKPLQLPQPMPFDGHEKMTIKVPIPFVKGLGFIWHTVPNNHPDQVALSLVQSLLNNDGKTGLLDRLTIDGKVMEAAAINFALNDMGLFGVYIMPKLLQSSYLVKRRVQKAIDKIKRGDFSTQALEEVKQSVYKANLLQLESSEQKAKLLSSLFAQNETWSDLMRELDLLSSISKEEVVEVAQRYLDGNYLEVKKQTGRYAVEKLPKPPYQPVKAPNQGAKSEFSRYLETLEIPKLPMKYLDFKKDAEQRDLSANDLVRLYKVGNEINDLFSLDLLFFRQSYYHPLQTYLEQYLDLVGGAEMSAHELNQRLQSLGATITYESKPSFFCIRISGFDHYLSETIALVGSILNDIKVEKPQIKKIIEARKISDRAIKADITELSKRLLDLARYGEKAPYKADLSLPQLRRITAQELVTDFHQLLQSELDIHYTGKLDIEKVASCIKSSFNLDAISECGEGYFYVPSILPSGNRILLHNEPSATQVVIKGYLPMGVLSDYEKSILRVYSTYLGSGMSSLLFQEIREYRSLAYSVSSFASFAPHSIHDGQTDLLVYLSTQTDKLLEVIELLNKLIHRSPDDPNRLEIAINTLRSDVRSTYPAMRMKSRTIASHIRQGYNKDIALIIEDNLKSITLQEVLDFHIDKVIKSPITLSMIGNIDDKMVAQLSESFQITRVSKKQLL